MHPVGSCVQSAGTSTRIGAPEANAAVLQSIPAAALPKSALAGQRPSRTPTRRCESVAKGVRRREAASKASPAPWRACIKAKADHFLDILSTECGDIQDNNDVSRADRPA